MKSWLLESALPLWSTAGFDASRGAFEERLTLDGVPVRDVPRRLMVQARQIYSYATAERLGWMHDASALVATAARAMVRDYYRDGRWVFSVDHLGNVADPAQDFYAIAFALLGLASAFRSTRDERHLDLADATLRFLDAVFANPAGGYRSRLLSDEFHQNPHMHLLEALLELDEVAPGRGYERRARAIVELFRTRLFASGIVVEYFDANWAPVAGDRGRFFEPGHHYEWAWLLERYGRMLGENISSTVDSLIDSATARGWSPSGLLYSEVREDGTVLNQTSRLWPHTEALKASLISSRSPSADVCLKALYERFVKPAHPGGWHDHFDASGTLLVDYMPASSLYHVVCALAEVERFKRVE